MQKINSLTAFDKIVEYADLVISGEMKVKDFSDIFDELTLYRKFFAEWQGEQSREYLLSNALLIASKAISGTPDGVSVKDWFAKYPLYSEWLTRINELRHNYCENNYKSSYSGDIAHLTQTAWHH